MFKKTVKYVDYYGKTREEDLYFNLNRIEIARMEASSQGGLVDRLQRIAKANNDSVILQTFEDIVLSAYGIKSEDGRSFRKTPQIREEFAQSEAYNVLLEELSTDDKAGAEFINNLVTLKNGAAVPAPASH